MELTRFTDYSLRLLMYSALHSNERLKMSEVAQAFGIAENHLSKIVNKLSHLGYIQTTRGIGGGIQLAKPPENINLGQLVRATEISLNLIDCKKPHPCPITPVCALIPIFNEAVNAFLTTLDKYSLADLVKNSDNLLELLQNHKV